MKRFNSFLSAAAILLAAVAGSSPDLSACTGISLTARDGSKVIGRTMEWGTFKLESHLVIVPRGHVRQAVTPTGMNGIMMKAKYGYAGIGVLEHNFIAEGMNEKGLVGELFYFPGYGEYQEYDPAHNATTISDAQLLDWILCNFATISEMEQELYKIRFVNYGQGFQSTHFNLGDATGRQVVLEFFDGRFHVFENAVGVCTNAPEFSWHMTNLNNYVNIFAGMDKPREITPGVTLRPIGMGSSSVGLPGDFTPPSRFVRAAFYVHSAPQQESGWKTVKQVFQILNNFDIPLGSEYTKGEEIPDFISGTQWTTVSDIMSRKLYYKTEWNYMIRCVDLSQIDFGKVSYQVLPLDKEEEYPVEMVKINKNLPSHRK